MDNPLTLIAFLFPLAYSPGPGNLFFAALGARFGFRATIPANAGYHVATLAMTVTVGFGFAAIQSLLPSAFWAMKVFGSAYVLWLAWRLFTAGPHSGAVAANVAGFWDGVALLALNPKAYVIIGLMFTQFLGAQSGNNIGPVLMISALFTLNNFVAFSLWTFVGDWLARLLVTSGAGRNMNMFFGAVLAAVAIWMLVS